MAFTRSGVAAEKGPVPFSSLPFSSHRDTIQNMLVVLVITDSGGKNLVFATDTLKAYGLDDAVMRVKKGEVQSIHVVKSGPGSYLRSNQNQAVGDNLDALLIRPTSRGLQIKNAFYPLARSILSP